MRLHIDCDEWYPVFGLETPGPFSSRIIEISEEDYADYCRMSKEF